MIAIIPAYDDDPLDDAIMICQQYVDWMIAEIPIHYPNLDLVAFKSEHHYDDIHAKFPGDHIPPDGNLLLATYEGQPAGCVALGKLADDSCEVRALYVLPDFRGKGIGKKLVHAILGEAQKIGYHYARLDTLRFMEGAYTLYQSLGFYAIEPYLDLPESLKGYIRFLEYNLSNTSID